MEWSGKGEKRKEIMQRSFLRFFVYSPLISESWTPQKSLSEFRPQSYNAGPQSQENAPREGSDKIPAVPDHREPAFQSTLPVRGATGRYVRKTARYNGFQSTLPVRGATTAAGFGRVQQCISIHAPREGSDRTGWPVAVFQSTLPVRGATVADLAPARESLDFNPRSP